VVRFDPNTTGGIDARCPSIPSRSLPTVPCVPCSCRRGPPRIPAKATSRSMYSTVASVPDSSICVTSAEGW